MAESEPDRSERDSMGCVSVPAGVYWGAGTARAVENFQHSDLRFPRDFIYALGLIKYSAAEVNHEDGFLADGQARAIKAAALEVADGLLDGEFVVDIFQTGSGTSTNMNANEVIANRAIEILGGKRGDRDLVHPNDHVNRGTSSNDVIPTAIHIAAAVGMRDRLLPALENLHGRLAEKRDEFWDIVKTARTHLQDATPIRLGQEFEGYRGQIERAKERVNHAIGRLSQVALGGTACGTGLNARADFAGRVCALLSARTGLAFRETTNHFQAQSTLDEVVDASGALKTVAVSLMKIANDIRWLSCGPRTGLAEITLAVVQPGSSIMPGKTNPVIAEAVLMACAQVIGNDTTVTIAGQSGNFELNVMMPVAAYNILQSISLLASVTDNFAARCVAGIAATSRGPELVERGLGLATALVPRLGYDRAAAIAGQAALTGESVREVVIREGMLTAEEAASILDPLKMTGPVPS